MTENQFTSTLGNIQYSLELAISQVAVYNLYVDSHVNDSHFSNCLVSLQDSLKDISNRLHQFQQSTAIAPSVTLEDRTNG